MKKFDSIWLHRISSVSVWMTDSMERTAEGCIAVIPGKQCILPMNIS